MRRPRLGAVRARAVWRSPSRRGKEPEWREAVSITGEPETDRDPAVSPPGRRFYLVASDQISLKICDGVRDGFRALAADPPPPSRVALAGLERAGAAITAALTPPPHPARIFQTDPSCVACYPPASALSCPSFLAWLMRSCDAA
jgi:hypothetical protein